MTAAAPEEAPTVSVPDAASLEGLRRELDEKVAALRAATASGGVRVAAAAVAAAPHAAPGVLTKLLGLRKGEVSAARCAAVRRCKQGPNLNGPDALPPHLRQVLLTAEEAEERTRKCVLGTAPRRRVSVVKRL